MHDPYNQAVHSQAGSTRKDSPHLAEQDPCYYRKEDVGSSFFPPNSRPHERMWSFPQTPDHTKSKDVPRARMWSGRRARMWSEKDALLNPGHNLSDLVSPACCSSRRGIIYALAAFARFSLPVDATGEPPGRSEASRTNLPECQQPHDKACSKDAPDRAAYARIAVHVAAAYFLPQELPGRTLAGGLASS